jgi:hypothetical protein
VTGPSDRAVEAAGNAIAAQSFTEPHRLAEIALRVAGDPALGPHALVRLGDVLDALRRKANEMDGQRTALSGRIIGALIGAADFLEREHREGRLP